MAPKQNRTLVLRFRIEGNLRYLSHQETMTMFQRAFRRGGIDICYSQGYNPRPKLSLRLPRSVGILSDDELLCASVNVDVSAAAVREVGDSIQSQLPSGCELTEVELCESRVSYQPAWAVYEFPLTVSAVEGGVSDRTEALVRRLGENSPVFVERRGGKNKSIRRIDIGAYMESLECSENSLRVKCRVTPSGSVRIDEIMQVLGIDPGELAGAIRRESVGWERN